MTSPPNVADTVGADTDPVPDVTRLPLYVDTLDACW
jgi:hypothetical protein